MDLNQRVGQLGGGVQGISAPSSIPPIPLAVERQRKVLADLHDRITTLEQRLDMVMTQRPPEGRVEEKVATMVGLAEVLETNNDIAVRACSRLDEIVARLQL